MNERPGLSAEIAELFEEETRVREGREFAHTLLSRGADTRIKHSGFTYHKATQFRTHKEAAERGAQIAWELRKGRYVEDVAAEFGVSDITVRRYGATHGVRCFKRPCPATRNRALVIAELRAGAPCVRVAGSRSVSVNVVRKLARDLGLGAQPRPVADRDVRVLAEVLAKKRLADVARRHDLTYCGAYRLLLRYGVRLGREGRAGPIKPKRGPTYVPPEVLTMVRQWKKTSSLTCATSVKPIPRTKQVGKAAARSNPTASSA